MPYHWDAARESWNPSREEVTKWNKESYDYNRNKWKKQPRWTKKILEATQKVVEKVDKKTKLFDKIGHGVWSDWKNKPHRIAMGDKKIANWENALRLKKAVSFTGWAGLITTGVSLLAQTKRAKKYRADLQGTRPQKIKHFPAQRKVRN